MASCWINRRRNRVSYRSGIIWHAITNKLTVQFCPFNNGQKRKNSEYLPVPAICRSDKDMRYGIWLFTWKIPSCSSKLGAVLKQITYYGTSTHSINMKTTWETLLNPCLLSFAVASLLNSSLLCFCFNGATTDLLLEGGLLGLSVSKCDGPLTTSIDVFVCTGNSDAILYCLFCSYRQPIPPIQIRWLLVYCDVPYALLYKHLLIA